MKKIAPEIEPKTHELEPTPMAEVVVIPSTEFVQVEKNLASMGFFSATTTHIKDAKSKTVTFTRERDGKRGVVTVTIVPAAIHGLPTTADQDKWIAFQKLVESRRRGGIVSNPVSFTSAEMLELLGVVDSGENYQDLYRWLDLMAFTGIISEWGVYSAGKKISRRDVYHVFDRVVRYGKYIEEGIKADQNHAWFSEWQLENINNNHTLPIEHEAYKLLKAPIAKALVPLLQVWLYASESEGKFEKRYDELCQYLNITQYQHLSQIKRKLSPALDELKAHGYLKSWKVEKAEHGYKVIFYHGEKYRRDRQLQRERKQDALTPKLDKKPRQLQLAAPVPVEVVPASVVISASSLTPEQEKLYKQLTQAPFCVNDSKAKELVTMRLESVKTQLAAFPFRKLIIYSSLGGWIVSAITAFDGQGYNVPEAYKATERKAEEVAKARARRSAIEACSLCDSSGFRMVKTAKSSGAKECSHNPEIEARYPSL
jgi:hypothetical protein